MELTEKLQVLESLSELKQKVNTLDLTDRERELFNNWYEERTAFFNEFIVKVFNSINTNFTFFLPNEILVKIEDSDNFYNKYQELSNYRDFFAETCYQYIGEDLYDVIRPKDGPEYNSNSLKKFLEQLNKYEIHYKLLYQL